ncbi:carbonic anhydrase [Variovorax saccharolyticus]|uniref:carbonic anhydrase n=1 Tax=Variovorax saccharolyticus TaxID=3053516 RepID=UPI0025766F76|nr:carbonic anhydrase family protein [Variovorax sp. J31P216]MDM0023722.1 carbonic anhydrase family protein [Variovorax sp. J31P216]
MSNLSRPALAGLLALGLCNAASALEHAHWSYAGKTGPAEWAALAPDNQLCKTGQQQSPIDLHAAKARAPASHDVAIRYGRAAGRLVNNGHTLELDLAGPSDNLVVHQGVEHRLAQFHFHTPSEHRLEGRAFPMELHLVNKSADGGIAVVGVLIREGRKNGALAPIFAGPPKAGAAGRDLQIDLAALLPADRKALRYTGSLTTPPCTEQVHWMVLEQPIEMSAGQIAAFRRLFPDNHRPVQPLNGREPVEENAGE